MPEPEESWQTVYVSIDNSDDKLPQQQWHEFWSAVHRQVFNYAARVHGDWMSNPVAPFQNACVCFEVEPLSAGTLRAELRKVAARYGQDSIAWAEALTDFIEPRQDA